MKNERETWLRWCGERERALAAPDSWLGLAGLYWLEEGANCVGTNPDAAVLLPHGPARLGELVWLGNSLHWAPVGGEVMSLDTDRDGAPTIVTSGDAAFFVIERDGRLAARVRDLAWAARTPFVGLDRFAYDPAWRIEAEWRPLDPPQVMEVSNVSGDLKPLTVSWQAVFEFGGQTVSLLPMGVSDRKLFFVFRDATSGRVSYGAGRFLDAAPAQDGRVILDFNYAYIPPCAFTPFATCPLPPSENWLPFAVEAGERKYA